MVHFWSFRAAAVAAMAVGPVLAQPSVSATGVWTVTGVRNDPDMAITALLDDDPAYLGATLTVSAGSIAWAQAASDGRGTYEDCPRPRFAASRETPGALAVACGGAPWGPDAMLRPLGPDRLELDWYDGGILTLTRG